MPLSKLKIERSLIADLPSSRNDAAIVNALVLLARALELDLVAEGVETEAQRTLLTQIGCDQLQGWLVCKPLPPNELAKCFASQALRMHSGNADLKSVHARGNRMVLMAQVPREL